MDSRGPDDVRNRIEIFAGDITTLDLDAIVNAANEALAPGAGVCGAIHRAAGLELAGACRAVAPCPTGEARITPGFALKARHVIHTVGPVWHGGGSGEAEMLASCYRTSLDLAREHNLSSIAFPALSTGIFGYPIEEASRIAVRTVSDWLALNPGFQRVVFAVFGADAESLYRRILDR